MSIQTDLNDRAFTVTNISLKSFGQTGAFLKSSALALMREHLAHHGYEVADYVNFNMFFDELRQRPGHIMLVAHTGSTVLGLVTAFEHQGGIIHLEDIVTGDIARGSGIGRELMQALGEEALKRGNEKVQWVVADDNPSAQRFYDNLGCTKTDDTILRLSEFQLATLGKSLAIQLARYIHTEPGHVSPHFSTWGGKWGTSYLANGEDRLADSVWASIDEVCRQGRTGFFDIYLPPTALERASELAHMGFEKQPYSRWEMPAKALAELAPTRKNGPFIPARRLTLPEIAEALRL